VSTIDHHANMHTEIKGYTFMTHAVRACTSSVRNALGLRVFMLTASSGPGERSCLDGTPSTRAGVTVSLVFDVAIWREVRLCRHLLDLLEPTRGSSSSSM
jgi:hypothetical protein